MQPVRPTLAQALLTGSLQHFLAALFIPVLLIGIGVCLRLARLAGGFPVAEILAGVAFVTAVYAVVLGTIFLFHEVVLLIAVVIERRRRRVAAVTTDVANDLLMAVVATDIVAEMLLFALLAWQGEDMRDVLYFFLLPIVGFYGVYLFGCRVREALAPPPAPPGSIVAAEALGHPGALPSAPLSPPGSIVAAEALPPPPVPATSIMAAESLPRTGATPPGRGMPGLQVYATGAAAWLGWCALGASQGWLASFGIAIFSILVGRAVARTAVKWKQTRQESGSL